MPEIPPLTCARCGEEVDNESRIGTSEESSVCKSCATEGEIEEWEEYVDEMEMREAAAQERRRNRANGHL